MGAAKRAIESDKGLGVATTASEVISEFPGVVLDTGTVFSGFPRHLEATIGARKVSKSFGLLLRILLVSFHR